VSALERLRERLHRRKRNRERKRRLHQGRRAMREARALQHLRALVDHLRKEPRVMFDDTSVDLIPITARAVAGYVNGAYQTIAALRIRFKGRRIVTIAVTSVGRAQFLDIESGNATIADAAGWWRRNRGHGARGFYIAESEASDLVAAIEREGIHRPEYVLWTAHYWGPRHICGPKSCGSSVEADGTQWTDRSNGKSLDESWLRLSFWRRLPAPSRSRPTVQSHTSRKDPRMLKTGKLPFVADERDLKLSDYLSALPTPPADFGHEDLVTDWGMLGNGPDDSVEPGFGGAGDCVFAGGDHETLMLGAEGSHHPTFTGAQAIADYSAVTGYVLGDESTDRGTDVREALKYRKATGLVDAGGHRHRIGAFLQLDKDLDQIFQAAYVFGCVGIGIEFPESAMQQFDDGEAWDVVKGSPIDGGHYIPVVGRNGGNIVVVTWGKTQEMTPAFFAKYCDEAWVYVSASALDADGKTPEGFDKAQLLADLKAL
jgi:hypothetical protein